MRRWIGALALCLLGVTVFSGFTCGPTLKDCAQQSDCPIDHRCRSYRCQQLDHCQSDSDCNAPRTCLRNRCVDPAIEACRIDQECATGESCAAGTCKSNPKPTCQAKSDCKTGQICQNGACVPDPNKPCAQNADCKTGEICQNGACVPDPNKPCAQNADCKTGEICQSGACIPDPNKPCAQNADCKTGETCQNGACIPTQTGICRLQVSPSSLSFYELKLGESKTQSLTLTNQGDGPCQISHVALTNASASVGVFSLPTAFSAQSLAASAKITLDIRFEAIAAGSHKATLDIFSNQNVLRSVDLYASVKGDTSLPTSGWATVAYESFGGGDYIGGCFWDNQTFETATMRAFREGGINMQYGNLRVTKDGGSTWTCANCIQGQGFPRTAHYEIVDLTVFGIACLGGRGYVFGSFWDANPSDFHPSLFSRTSQTNWTPNLDRNNILNGSLSTNRKLLVVDGRWFVTMENMILSFVPESNGDWKTQKLVYFNDPAKANARFQSLHIAQQTALLVGSRDSFVGGNFQVIPFVSYNTTNAELPAGTTMADMPKYWTDATMPCTSCSLTVAYVLGAQSFLVMGHLLDAQKQPAGIALWRSDDRGARWQKVFEHKATTSMPHGDILSVDGNRIFAVAGGLFENQGGTQSEGLLLESTDGGKTFASIPITQLKGKHIDTGKIPSLYALRLSPDQKTLFVLGQGVILRWKP